MIGLGRGCVARRRRLHETGRVPRPLRAGRPRSQETRCFMPISQDLLEILVCPLCKEPVALTPNSQGLKCSKCGRVYPIKDDIPVMLIDEASVEE